MRHGMSHRQAVQASGQYDRARTAISTHRVKQRKIKAAAATPITGAVAVKQPGGSLIKFQTGRQNLIRRLKAGGTRAKGPHEATAKLPAIVGCFITMKLQYIGLDDVNNLPDLVG